jgi:hypothetical protein
MCERCNNGSLGYGPDGDRVFCDCREGVKAALKESCNLIGLFADQLVVFDRHAPLPPLMQTGRKLIQIAYDTECLVHDSLEAKLEVTR